MYRSTSRRVTAPCAIRNLAQPAFVAPALCAAGLAQLRLGRLPSLQKEDAECVRIVTHGRVHHGSALEIDITLAASRGRMKAQPAALARQVEELEHVVDSNVLKRTFDCHQPFSSRAS